MLSDECSNCIYDLQVSFPTMKIVRFACQPNLEFKSGIVLTELRSLFSEFYD